MDWGWIIVLVVISLVSSLISKRQEKAAKEKQAQERADRQRQAAEREPEEQEPREVELPEFKPEPKPPQPARTESEPPQRSEPRPEQPAGDIFTQMRRELSEAFGVENRELDTRRSGRAKPSDGKRPEGSSRERESALPSSGEQKMTPPKTERPITKQPVDAYSIGDEIDSYAIGTSGDAYSSSSRRSRLPYSRGRLRDAVKMIEILDKPYALRSGRRLWEAPQDDMG